MYGYIYYFQLFNCLCFGIEAVLALLRIPSIFRVRPWDDGRGGRVRDEPVGDVDVGGKECCLVCEDPEKPSAVNNMLDNSKESSIFVEKSMTMIWFWILVIALVAVYAVLLVYTNKRKRQMQMRRKSRYFREK